MFWLKSAKHLPFCSTARGTGDKEQRTENREQRADKNNKEQNKEQRTENRETKPRIENREEGTENREHDT